MDILRRSISPSNNFKKGGFIMENTIKSLDKKREIKKRLAESQLNVQTLNQIKNNRVYIKRMMIYEILDLFRNIYVKHWGDFGKVTVMKKNKGTLFQVGNYEGNFDKYDYIKVPNYFTHTSELESNQCIFIMEFLKHCYDFDFEKFSKEHNLNIVTSFILYSVCHEIGHLVHSFEEVDRYGEFKIRKLCHCDLEDLIYEYDKLTMRSEFEESSEKYKILWADYRFLNIESYADIFAIKHMENEKIIKIIKKYMK